jgi:hypothetical protein
MGIEEEVYNKIIAENFPNLEKNMHIQEQKASGTPSRHD